MEGTCYEDVNDIELDVMTALWRIQEEFFQKCMVC